MRLGGQVEHARAAAKVEFDAIDTDCSGRLTKPELGKLAKRLAGRALPPAELSTMMRQIDKDESGEVDFEEFYAWWWVEREPRAALLAEARAEVTADQVSFVERNVDQLRRAGEHPAVTALLEGFRLGLVAQKRRQEEDELARREAAEQREREAAAAETRRLAAAHMDELLQQGEWAWETTAGEELLWLLGRSVAAGLAAQAEADEVYTEVTLKRMDMGEAAAWWQRRWRGFCSTQAGSPKPGAPGGAEGALGAPPGVPALDLPELPELPPPAPDAATHVQTKARLQTYWYEPEPLPQVEPPNRRERRARRLAAAEADALGGEAGEDWDSQLETTLDPRWCKKSAAKRGRLQTLPGLPAMDSAAERSRPGVRLKWHARDPLSRQEQADTQGAAALPASPVPKAVRQTMAVMRLDTTEPSRSRAASPSRILSPTAARRSPPRLPWRQKTKASLLMAGRTSYYM